MSVLPDCAICGGPVVLEPEGDRGPVEECGWCGNRQRPIPPRIDRAAIRTAVRESRVVRRLLGPSCYGRRHTRCTAQLCECACHDKEKTK